MQGMMWLYARNVTFLERHYCKRHGLENLVLKATLKGHAETCWLILFSSLSCVVYPPMVPSNFLGGCPNHEKISGWVGMDNGFCHCSGKIGQKVHKTRHTLCPNHSWTPYWLVFFVAQIGFWQYLAEVVKTLRQPTKTSQWGNMSSWNIGFVFYLCLI